MAAGLSRALGPSPRVLRAVLLAVCSGGFALALASAVFDHALPGGPLPEGLRRVGMALGIMGVLSYPALALLLPDGRGRDARGVGRWDFGSSLGMLLLLVVLGQTIGFLIEPYWQAARERWHAGDGAWFVSWLAEHPFALKDLVLLAFFFSASSFVWVQRRSVRGFFRSMHTGVGLVSLVTLAITLGVLVPQIDGFEDPERRVDMEREAADYQLFERFGYQKLPLELQDGHEQYQAFRWAEGYFLYHLKHLYGVGMPEAALTPRMEEGLESFGRRYGLEERDNRRKEMLAAFSGREKIQEIAAFIQEHEETLWRFFQVSTALQLNRTYKSHWFTSLLFLLFAAVSFNTFKGSPRGWFKIQKLGFFTVHLGMLVLLVGGFTSKLFTDRGVLQLYLGRTPEDSYWRNSRVEKRARMPFAVRLDHFARNDWKALEVHFLEDEFTSRPPRYTLWPGRELELDYADDDETGLRPRIQLRVLELFDRVEVGLPLAFEVQDPEESGLPLAELRTHDTHLLDEDHPPEEAGHDHARRLFLPPMLRGTQSYAEEVYRDPAGGFRLAGAFGPVPERRFPTDAPGEEVLALLETNVVGEGAGAPEARPIRLGETLELPGGYRVEVVDATSDFAPERNDRTESTHPLSLAEQPYRFAAVWVDIVPPDDGPSERRLVLEHIDPVEYGIQADYFHADVVLKLAWNDWSSPGPPRFLLHWSDAGDTELLAETGESSPVELGVPLELLGSTLVEPLQILSRARFEKNLGFPAPVERSDGWDEEFYARSPRGARIEVVHEPGTPAAWSETVEMATTDQAQSNLWYSGDGRFALRFVENSEMLPFEWRSVLTIVDEDNAGRPYEVPLGSERQREIRVNDYFQYGGYRFFQTNADPSQPTYSGVGVVYDPGIPIVLVGMYTIIAGTAIAFLIRPVVLARRGRVA